MERPSFFPLGSIVFKLFQNISSDFPRLVDVSSLSCDAHDMPALHRKISRLRHEGFVAATSSCTSSAVSVAQEKLYSNADVSNMVKDAVSTAVAHTKEKYEKILQEKLAGSYSVVLIFPILRFFVLF